MIKPLTSLRFVFAFMVFLHHLSFLKNIDGFFSSFYKTICAEGYIGVNFFFMLSGFILAYVYQEKMKKNEIKNIKFLIYRFARIYPLHLLTLIIAIPITFSIFSSDIVTWIVQFISNIFLVQSFIPKLDYYFGFNSVSWSISTEMFFYLIFPFVIPLISKISENKYILTASLVFIAIIAFLGSTLISPSYHHSLFYINPLFRFMDFAIGIIIYNLVKGLKITSRKANFLEIIAILLMATCFILSNHVPQVFRYSIYYWIPTALLIGVYYFQSGFLSKYVFSNKYFVILGEISFGFYMFHQLIMKYFDKINSQFFQIDNPIIIISIYLVLTLTVSILSYYYFELPVNRFIKRKLIKKP